MVVVRRMKAVMLVVTTKPLLKGKIMVKAVRSAESAVSSCSRVKASKLYAKLRLQPNAVAMADVERTSMGTTMELGISKRWMMLAKKTRRLVRNVTEAWQSQYALPESEGKANTYSNNGNPNSRRPTRCLNEELAPLLRNQLLRLQPLQYRTPTHLDIMLNELCCTSVSVCTNLPDVSRLTPNTQSDNYQRPQQGNNPQPY
jgi:hypothetical protein